MNVIEIKNLKKHFGKVKALDGISFDVKKGEIFGFLGPNGAGKTTTIRCMMDFLRPSSGKVNILGLDARQSSVDIKKRIGYLTSDLRLYDNWTGQDHIKFLEDIFKKASNAKDLAKRLGLNRKLKFKNLSSGNKQKLGLVLALMFSPEIVILDEPTAGLDPLLQNTVYEIIKELQQKGSTIFMSSHNLAEVERICTRAAVIKNGKLVAIEEIDKLRGKRIHFATIRFVGDFKANDFKFDGVEIREKLSDGLILSVKGDIDPLMKKIAHYKIKDLEVTHASLEEVFLEFYKS
jgi:ABC-2 type transport system ATP-binding protein